MVCLVIGNNAERGNLQLHFFAPISVFNRTTLLAGLCILLTPAEETGLGISSTIVSRNTTRILDIRAPFLLPMATLPPGAKVEKVTVKRLTLDIPTPYAQIIDRFRTLVPRIDLSQLRAQNKPEGIEDLIRTTGTTTGFVTFTEFDHGRWIRHFPPFSNKTPDGAGELTPTATGRGVHRFIFGNPLFAITMLRESLEAALHVPLDCSFVEQVDGSARIIMLLPDSLVAGHAAVSDNEALHNAALDLEGKVYRLIEEISK